VNWPLTWRLIRSDLYLRRWMIVGSTLAGLLCVAMSPLSRAAYYVGSVSLICVLIVLNIFLVMSSVAQERKDKVLLFVLGLPLSPREYALARLLGGSLAFVVPWGLLAAASVGWTLATAIPDGVIPLTLSVFGFMLAYYGVLLGVALVSDHEHWSTAVIIAGNVSINFYITLAFGFPSVAAHASSGSVVWGPEIVATLAIELAVYFVALLLAYGRFVRKGDYV
jgi:ABC-type transport system involved in multi-copper enzyme maturation permease subunit